MRIANRPFILLQETTSTNSYLKEISSSSRLEEGTIVQTLFQTAGRGQAGNFWESERGKNLTFSLILYPRQLPVANQFLISQLVSLAIFDVLSEETDSVSIKWPNDIYYKEQKICGILIESAIEGNQTVSAIIGVGLNVNQVDFKSNAPNPVSLQQITGKSYHLQRLLEHIICRLMELYEQLEDRTALVARYKENLFRRDGGFHPFADKQDSFFAQIVDVESNGVLILEKLSGERKQYSFKEVSFIL